MKVLHFRVPTSVGDIRQLIKEKHDKRYNHNKQVMRNMYKEIVDNLKMNQRGFKESAELKGCLIRGLKAID